MKRIVLAGFFALAFSNAVLAIEPGPSSATQKSTENWLQLQVSGKAASPRPQIQAPIERDLSMQRWLNNYQHPIPEFFEQNKGGSVSGGGSGGN